MELEKLLDELTEKLKEERELILNSLKDRSYSESLSRVVEQKKEIISKISEYPQEELIKFENKLREIKELSEGNLVLALNGVQFIDEVFEAIFKDENIKTYSSEGSFSKETKGFINKKI